MKGHTMSKKDFEMIARVLREHPHAAGAGRIRLARAFAAELAATSPRFDRERFIAACMGEDSHDSAGRKVRYSADPLAGRRS
jgi:hypothetical protein